MPLPDHVLRARADLLARMRVAVEREAARAGIWDAAPRDRVRLLAAEPGALTVEEPHGGRYRLAFPQALRLLSGIPDRAGHARIRAALGEAREGGRMRVHPRNDPNWLQPGDRLGDAVVSRILVGRSYDNAKTGDPVEALPRAALARSHEAERVFVLLDGPGGGYGRRGTQVGMPPAGKGPGPGREDLPALRRGHARLKGMLRREERAIARAEGSAPLLLDLVGLVAATRRLVEVSAMGPAATPDREERTRLRQLDAALRESGHRLERLGAFGHGAGYDPAKGREAAALGLIAAERAGHGRALRLVGARIRAERAEADAEAAPAGPTP